MLFLRQVTGAIVGCCFIIKTYSQVAKCITILSTRFFIFLSTANKPAVRLLKSTINALTHFQSNGNYFFFLIFILQENMSFIIHSTMLLSILLTICSIERRAKVYAHIVSDLMARIFLLLFL